MSKLFPAAALGLLAIAVAGCRSPESNPVPAAEITTATALPEIRYYEIADT